MSLDAATLRRLERLPSVLGTAQETAVGRAAFAAKRSIQRQPGYASRMRGVGKKGARLNVRYDVKGQGVRAVALVRATGPFHLLERDTKPHPITPKRGRRGSGRRALTTPYGPKASVQHPGTRGRHPFEHGVEAALPAIRREVHQAFVSAFARGR